MSPAAIERHRRWKLILTLITFGALILLIVAVRKQIGQTISDLDQVNLWVLALMIPLQALNYDAYTRMYRQVFNVLGEKIGYKDMYKVQLELNFVNHIFPSGGVSGFSYFGVRMKDYNIPAGKSTLLQFLRFMLIFISFQALLLVGLLMLAAGGKVNNFVILLSGSLVTLLIVATFGLVFVVGSKVRINSFTTSITRAINRFIHFFRPNNPETISLERVRAMFSEMHENYVLLKNDFGQLKQPLYQAFVANLTEVLTLYVVYIAFGKWINPGSVILAYAVANFAGLISFLPGGVGIFEPLMAAVLVATGVPAGLSISVTVMYRVLSMAIQLTPGYFVYYRNLHDNKKTAIH